MIIEKIVQIGDPMLLTKTKSVKNKSSKETLSIVNDLVDTMRNGNLIGMAANQIGKGFRIFVTEIRKTPYRSPEQLDELRIYINPKIIKISKSQCVIYEGCGSVAQSQIFAPIKRPKTVTIEACDQAGKKFTLSANGLLARVIQHEMDHLNGITFLERVSDPRKILNSEEYKKKFC